MSSTKPRIFFTRLSTEGTQPALDPLVENILQEDFELITSRMVEEKPELWDTIQGSVTYTAWEPEQRRLLEKARNLKVVCSLGVGTNHLDLDYWKSRGIPVGYTPTAVTDATADMAFALILTTICRIKKGLLLLYAKELPNPVSEIEKKNMEQRSKYLKAYWTSSWIIVVSANYWCIWRVVCMAFYACDEAAIMYLIPTTYIVQF